MALVTTGLAAAVSLVLERRPRQRVWTPLLWAFVGGFVPALLGALLEESLRTALLAGFLLGTLFAAALGSYWIPLALLGRDRSER